MPGTLLLLLCKASLTLEKRTYHSINSASDLGVNFFLIQHDTALYETLLGIAVKGEKGGHDAKNCLSDNTSGQNQIIHLQVNKSWRLPSQQRI